MDKAAKEYNKITVEQFQQLLAKLPEVRLQKADFDNTIKATHKKRLDELLDRDFAWANVYEKPFYEHIAMLVLALDKQSFLSEALKTPDPQQIVLDHFNEDVPEEWTGGYGGLFEKKHLIGLVVSLQKSIQSIMIYQRSLSALVGEVREGSVNALFDAVRIDRTITACPTIADRICKADLLQDKQFFIRLRNAFKGPSGKHWQAYQDLRYAFAVLREMGFDKLSDKELEHLLVDQLKVYPSTYNARRNLRKQYEQSKKFKHLR